MKEVAVGVDIGGSGIKLGVVDRGGKVILRDAFPTGSEKSRDKLLKLLVRRILSLCREAKRRRFRLLGVGVGAPGPIDIDRGFVYFFPNIPGWKNTPLQRLLTRRLRLPVCIDNDANAMALGEFSYGAGRGARNMIALTLGTGVGGGLILNGKLFHGPVFSAAEIGHLVVNEGGPVCSCGSRGCIETYVGSGYFIKEIRKRLNSGQKSLLKKWLKEGQDLTPFLVAKAARAGDGFARNFWRETGGHLGTVLAGLVNILNPDRIILGGGIAQSGRMLFGPTVAALRKKAFPIAARSVKVLPAALGVDAGLIGAASLVFSRKEFRG